MKKTLFIALALMTCAARGMAQTPQVVAHRGYWDTPTSAQNSIRSLVKADSIGCYGSEFDVWLTADNKLIVHHDYNVGKHIIETSPSADILAQRLANGEHVPTLEAYLTQAEKLGTRLVLELKAHKDKANDLKAARMIMKAVRRHKLQDKVDYITFSRTALDAFLKHAPKGTPIYYLSGDLSPEQLKQMGATGADYHIDVFRRDHPEWIAQMHRLGLKVNIWTVNSPADLQWCIDQKADFITTNAPTLLQQMLGK